MFLNNVILGAYSDFCNLFVFFRDLSPSSSSGMCERSPGTDPLSPQSHCSSPSMSRLTYLSINENTTLPTPNHHQVSIELSMLKSKWKQKNICIHYDNDL